MACTRAPHYALHCVLHTCAQGGGGAQEKWDPEKFCPKILARPPPPWALLLMCVYVPASPFAVASTPCEPVLHFPHRILEDRLKALIKPQYVDIIPKTVKGIVKDLLKQKDERDVMAHYVDDLQLQSILDRDVAALSGGELQRFTIAISCVQKADVYMYDEPSSYLDVKQRLKAAKTIRNMIKSDNYIICVEHDLSVLDYLSDFICCLYGVPGGYGVVTMPFGVREGILMGVRAH